MKLRHAMAMVLGMFMAACGESAVGSWVIDKEKTSASIESAIESETENAGPMDDVMVGTAKSMIDNASMNLSIKKDGTYDASGRMGPGDFTSKGKWERDGDTYILSPEEFGPVLKATVEGSNLVIAGPDEPGGLSVKMYLKRR